MSSEAPITKGAFVRAMEPIRGRRFLAFRKNKLARRVLGLMKPTRLYVELNVDSIGYCTLVAHKTREADTEMVEQYRFVGPNLNLEVLHKLPMDISTEDSATTNCIKLKPTSDLRRWKPSSGALVPLEGDLYICANDSGLVSLLKLALLALGRSAQQDGQCIFANVFDKPFAAAAAAQPALTQSSFAKQQFRLSRLEQVQFSRSVAVLMSRPMPPNLHSLASVLQHKIAPTKAWELLQKPPGNNSTTAEEEMQVSTAALHLLLTVVTTCKPRPISFPCFQLFVSQAAEKMSNNNNNNTRFQDSEGLAVMCTELLVDLRNDNAVAFIQQLTRVVKQWSSGPQQHIMLMEWSELLGPGLVDSFAKREHAEPMLWFLTSVATSRYRDKIFAKFNRNSNSFKAAAPSPQQPQQKQLQQEQQHRESSLSLPMMSDTSPPPLPPQQRHESFTTDATSSRTLTPQPVDYDGNNNVVLLQDDIDALTRLVDYLQQRLQEEEVDTGSHLYGLLKAELKSAQRELAISGGSGMTSMLSQLNTSSHQATRSSSSSSSSFNSDSSDKEDEERSNRPKAIGAEADEERSNHPKAIGAEAEEEDAFTKQVIELWAESRREALTGTQQDLNEAGVMLRNTLEEVRDLANTVAEYPLKRDNKQASIALVAMLEENITLRLKLISKEQHDATARKPPIGLNQKRAFAPE